MRRRRRLAWQNVFLFRGDTGEIEIRSHSVRGEAAGSEISIPPRVSVKSGTRRTSITFLTPVGWRIATWLSDRAPSREGKGRRDPNIVSFPPKVFPRHFHQPHFPNVYFSSHANYRSDRWRGGGGGGSTARINNVRVRGPPTRSNKLN